MSKLCRQVSIESPGATLKECVFSFDVPVPEVPMYGARIRVVYAGACYRANRTRSASVCSSSSIGSLSGETESFGMYPSMPSHLGLRDGALFPGYEVAGIVDAVGKAAERLDGIHEGSRIVLYPYEGVPHGYADYIVVPDFKCLVPIPDDLPLSIAAMLPTGALLAMNIVNTANECLKTVLEGPNMKDKAKVLIVGTGGMALWALRIAAHCFKHGKYTDRIGISVATFKDDGFQLVKNCEEYSINVLQWSEDLYEKQLIERTTDACGGPVDVVLNFGTTSRSLHRSLQCLAPIEPPPHSVFPAEEAQEVVRKLCNSEIKGRAILKFHNID
ncbi:putative zinc-dependent alcohol dehydrogenase [Operophtera brumata]|uniref:Putative zinc-dependent alcohol dehydrogenase n=1 Tax=Operophtera brumata TaxID=104452 RepID=A0A0L7LRN8_OPEBR|nr:putative zinc-dependent alcohol dehydrogenase [Operophtera brumata]